jgi:hypothetical protein
MSNANTRAENKDGEKPTTSEGSGSWENSSNHRNHCLFAKPTTAIKDVWEENFEEEIWKIMELVEKFNVIGMDTEFPGIVYRPDENEMSHFSDINLMNYKTIKMNVDNLKVIQMVSVFPMRTVTFQKGSLLGSLILDLMHIPIPSVKSPPGC